MLFWFTILDAHFTINYMTVLIASGHSSHSFLDSFRAFYPWFSGHSDSRVGMEYGLFTLWAVVAIFPAFPGPPNRS